MERNNPSTIKWIYNATKKYNGAVITVAVLSIATSYLSLYNATLLKDIIDAAVNKDLYDLKRSGFTLLAVTIISIALDLISRYIREKTSYKLTNHLQRRLFSVLLNKDYYSVSKTHSQEWLNRVNQDSTTIADAVTHVVPSLFGIVFHFIGAAYLIYTTSHTLIVLVAIGAILFVIFNYALRNPLKQSQRAVRNSVGKKNIYLSEHLSKLMIVKAFNREDMTVYNSDEEFANLIGRKMTRLRLLILKDGVQSSGTKLASFLALVYCATRILHGTMSYGAGVMLLKLLSQIRAPLSAISQYIGNIFDVSVAAERLMEPERYQDDPSVSVLSDKEIVDIYENRFKEIAFTDAAFSYLDELEENPNIEPTVFAHVDFTIPKKSSVAFTGITGSGKSTIFKLLMSLYPLQKGSKTIRYKDGSELPLDASFRRLFAYVPQGNQLMAGTIKEMITFGDMAEGKEMAAEEPSGIDDRIWSVLETACIKDFIESLPQQLNTVIGERGLGLSEGQLQRLAIARALYTNRPILLLDEATSSLDEETERQLLQNIKQMTDHTTLIVTHRPAALSICDYRIHIDGNRVTMHSTHTGNPD